MSSTEEIKRELTKDRESKVIKDDDLLSSGSTLVNLACSGSRLGAFPKGYYILFIGDSDSGKTWFCLNALAEAARKEAFKDYRLIYDGVEYGAIMDMTEFFGNELTERIEPPAGSPSETIEEFYVSLCDILSDGPCVYVLDSLDGLTSDPEQKKFQELVSKGAGKGDFGDGKAKINSRTMRVILKKLQNTKSILIVINQTRDNVGRTIFEPKQVHSGGRAITFYSTIKLWSRTAGKLKKSVRGKDLQVGIRSRIDVKRSRITGKQRSVEVPIYNTYGVDEVGSCIDYLVDWKVWNKKESIIKVTGLGPEFEKSRSKLIEHIEENSLEDDLSLLVENAWKEIELKCSMKERKRRY